MQHFAARVPLIRSHEDAYDIYNDAARLPASSTKQLLYEKESIKVRNKLNLAMLHCCCLASGLWVVLLQCALPLCTHSRCPIVYILTRVLLLDACS